MNTRPLLYDLRTITRTEAGYSVTLVRKNMRRTVQMTEAELLNPAAFCSVLERVGCRVLVDHRPDWWEAYLSFRFPCLRQSEGRINP